MNDITYPFQFVNSFFTKINIKRSNFQEKVEIPLNVSLKVIEPEFPKVQINMLVTTKESKSIDIELELVGQFIYMGDSKEYDKELDLEFAFNRASLLLFPFLTQMAGILTSQMGMENLKLGIPTNPVPITARTTEPQKTK